MSDMPTALQEAQSKDPPDTLQNTVQGDESGNEDDEQHAECSRRFGAMDFIEVNGVVCVLLSAGNSWGTRRKIIPPPSEDAVGAE